MINDLTISVDNVLMEEWLVRQENRHIATGHIGTHLDVYNKTDIPFEYIDSKGVLIDTREYCEEREIEVKDIEGMEIPKDSFVLIQTGRSEKYKYGTKEYFADHPQLSGEAIEYLINKDIRFIGIDCAGIRRGDEHAPADKLCEEHGTYVIENLTDLSQFSSSMNIQVYTMWLEDELATGLKCRVMVRV